MHSITKYLLETDKEKYLIVSLASLCTIRRKALVTDKEKAMNPEAFIVQGTSLGYNLIVLRLFKKAKTIESTILFAKKNTSN